MSNISFSVAAMLGSTVRSATLARNAIAGATSPSTVTNLVLIPGKQAATSSNQPVAFFSFQSACFLATSIKALK